MAKTKVVSSKTHNKAQLDDYANQHNPNNKAYLARKANELYQNGHKTKKKGKHIDDYYYPDFGFGWCDD